MIAAETRDALLLAALEVSVPLWIERARGWPEAMRLEKAAACARMIAAQGDVLQFGGRSGEAAGVFNALAEGLACLAFQPGGVRFCGRVWETKS